MTFNLFYNNLITLICKLNLTPLFTNVVIADIEPSLWFLDILYADSPFLLINSWFVFLIFMFLIEWLLLFILPTVAKTKITWFYWALLAATVDFGISFWIINTNPGLYRISTDFNLDFIRYLLINPWDLDTYSAFLILLLKLEHRLRITLIIFGLFVFINKLQLWNQAVNKLKILSRWNEKMLAALTVRPKVILFSSVFGVICVPTLISLCKDISIGLIAALGILTYFHELSALFSIIDISRFSFKFWKRT